MANKEPKGAYNRAPIFDGENYDYWKECMSIHIQSLDMDVWDAVVNGRFQPQVVANGVAREKLKADWSDDDKKKVQCDLKARNILISSLGVNEYHSVSHCKTAKAMWDALEILHKRTDDVKQSKINTLVQQYELFRMEDGESISSMQMRFTHIVNKLQNLGKDIPNQDCTNKILRCMTREWQPKVTTIKESQNLNTLSIITLFGKLKEHEHEILRLKSSKEELKKKGKKSIAFKASSSRANLSINGDSDSGGESPSKEDMGLFVKRFNRYSQKHGLRRSDNSSVNSRKMQTKGETSKEEKGPSCFGCGKFGHLKSECPDLIKPKGKASSSDKSKGRRAYIAWEDDETSSTQSDSENDEIAHLCFMGQKKKPLEVSDSGRWLAYTRLL
ncbi:phytoalexin-deficient 4-2 protein, partial [Trifolium medium]|nr:phytoalexin-deficient 4-2 protein [Trifolium medium]